MRRGGCQLPPRARRLVLTFPFHACSLSRWQHTYSHHSFTNDHERDPDCHHFETMLRIHFANPHNPLHRFLVHP